mgnify:CR=1 FL=1
MFRHKTAIKGTTGLPDNKATYHFSNSTSNNIHNMVDSNNNGDSNTTESKPTVFFVLG